MQQRNKWDGNYGKIACPMNEMEMASLKKNKGEKWIEHYSSSHKILLVGEGNFSFAACLGRAFGSATKIVATSFDSREMLKLKYYFGAKENLEELEKLGCTIIHQVNANTMSQHALLKLNLFDRIVFNFPHAGFFSRPEHIAFVIKRHKKLVRGFLRNAHDMLTENGEVHITHKTSHPYNMWEIEKLANGVGLVLINKVPFSISDYPGYQNKRGAGKKSNKCFPVGECSTFMFGKRHSIN